MDTRTLTLTLPAEIVDELDARVTAGLVQNIEDGIVDAVERSRGEADKDGRDGPELEKWVRTRQRDHEERVKSGRLRLYSSEELLARIEAREQ